MTEIIFILHRRDGVSREECVVSALCRHQVLLERLEERVDALDVRRVVAGQPARFERIPRGP